MTDKYCVQQVLGSLLKKPQLLSQVDRYNLAVTDFYTKLEKYVFIAILGLYQGGAKSISVLDVENYLDVDAGSKAFFDKQNGLAYTQDILEFAQIDNFDYYYQKLKKINLLNDLQKMGFSTDEFYISDLTNPKSTEVNEKFEHLTAKDITDKIKIKILGIEKDYQVSGDVITEYAVDGINDLIDYMDEVQDVGLPIQGTIYNQVINGAQPGTLTIRSASSGLGKTRSAIGDACFLAYPIRYNSASSKWEKIGGNEKVLFIVTEQNFKEVRKMILAYLTDMNESRFKYGNFNDDERQLLEEAKTIMEHYKDNFVLIKMPNPTIELAKLMIRENCLTKNIKYVFYDYIFISPSLLNEFKGFSLRNDKILSYI
jgi:replicative DNA helicase